MKFNVGCGGVEADHVEDSLDHMGLGKSNGAVGVASETGAEVILEIAVIGKIEFRLPSSVRLNSD